MSSSELAVNSSDIKKLTYAQKAKEAEIEKTEDVLAEKARQSAENPEAEEITAAELDKIKKERDKIAGEVEALKEMLGEEQEAETRVASPSVKSEEAEQKPQEIAII